MYINSPWHLLALSIFFALLVGALIYFIEEVVDTWKSVVKQEITEIDNLDIELEEARHDLQQAMKAFDNVATEYIDTAIYKWKAAEERYTKLLEEKKAEL